MLHRLRTVVLLTVAPATLAVATDWGFGITYAGHEWSGSGRQWEFGTVSALVPPLWLGPTASVWTGNWLTAPLPCSLQTAGGAWQPGEARPGFNNWLPIGIRFIPAAVVRNDGFSPACVNIELRYCGWTEVRLNCQTDRLDHFSTARGQMLNASVSLSSSLVTLRAGYEHFLIPAVRATLDDSTGFRQLAFPQRSIGRVFVGIALELDMLFFESPNTGDGTARLLLPPMMR